MEIMQNAELKYGDAVEMLHQHRRWWVNCNAVMTQMD